MAAIDATAATRRARARVFWAAVWLALALVALRASYLGSPEQRNLVKAMPERALELRRLAAWTEADRRQPDPAVQRRPAVDVIRVSDPSPATPKRD